MLILASLIILFGFFFAWKEKENNGEKACHNTFLSPNNLLFHPTFSLLWFLWPAVVPEPWSWAAPENHLAQCSPLRWVGAPTLRWPSTLWCQLLCSVTWTLDTKVSRTCVYAVWDETVSYTYTMTVHELTISRFIEGKRWQTAGSCKLSCIWDGKSCAFCSLACSWPAGNLFQSLYLCSPPHSIRPAHFRLRHSQHQDTANITTCSWRTCGTAEPIPRASRRHTRPHSGVQSKQQNLAYTCKQPGQAPWLAHFWHLFISLFVLFPWTRLLFSSIFLQMPKSAHSTQLFSKTFLVSAKRLTVFSVYLRRRCQPLAAEIQCRDETPAFQRSAMRKHWNPRAPPSPLAREEVVFSCPRWADTSWHPRGFVGGKPGCMMWTGPWFRHSELTT